MFLALEWLAEEGVKMTRDEFFKCTLGMCSCAAYAMLPPSLAKAESGNQEMDALKWKVDAGQKRFAKLVGILNDTLEEPTRKKVFERLGRACAQDYNELTDQYKGNVKGFLDYIQQRWVEKAEYDEKAGTIRIVDKSKTCSCPLVQKGLTSSTFCDCTLGWQKETYSKLLGKPVEAELEESILRGGKSCIFRIRVV
jgi:predicted hydrocarbon binding protein